jgi:RNA recognition motif-containing protein
MAKKLYVGNLPWKMTEEDLKNTFAGVGTVEDVKIIIDRETQRSRGFGFVTMASEEDAGKAIERLHDQEVGGRKLIVNEAREKDRNDPRSGGNGGAGYQRRPQYN